MTASASAGVGRFNTTTIALALGVLTLLLALLTPEPAGKSEGGLSSFSTAPGGAGIVYELAGRLGWHTERRIETLASLRAQGDSAPTVQVVLGPRESLGAHEIHDLLENVRRGGGLVLAVDDDEGLADSLGLKGGTRMQFQALSTTRQQGSGVGADACPPTRSSRSLSDALALPPEVRLVTWQRHAPGRVEPLVNAGQGEPTEFVAGLGFPMGKGRVAVVGGADVFSNAAVRVCRFGADVAAMRLIEYTRPPSETKAVLSFDEYHHGFGVHGGSLKASALYLWRVRSGHLLLQALAAGLLLLLAMAPRPLVPRDDTRVVRRSPLEHAAALGRAYEDVGATRTATSNLLGGLRRRTRGIVAVPASAGDDAFLAAVVLRLPSLGTPVEVVNRARTSHTPKRELASVGHALAAIEEQLQSTPSTRS